MTTASYGIDLARVIDGAELILAKSMHPVLARAVADLARHGASIPIDGAYRSRAHGEARGTPDGDDAPLLTTREAARRLHVSDKQVYRLVAQGRLRSRAFGRNHRFAVSDLEAAIEQSTAGARATRAARNIAEARRAA